MNWLRGSVTAAPDAHPEAPAPLCVLVIQSDAYDWATILAAALRCPPAGTLRLPPGLTHETALQVVQTSWEDIEVGAVDNDKDAAIPPAWASVNPRSPDDGPRVWGGLKCPVLVRREWRNGKPETGTFRPRMVYPNLVLVRNQFTTPQRDLRNQLLGLLYSGVPAVNSLHSVLLSADKPATQAAMHRLRATQCPDFPLLAQSFASSHDSFFYGRSFPAVVKFGSAHAGFGKLRVRDHHDMEDIKTLLPSTRDRYCTAEPFVPSAGDLRLQKIGAHTRAFHRISTCGAWKTNTQSAVMHEIPVTPQMRQWLLAAETLFGDREEHRMDILTIDVIMEAAPEVAEAAAQEQAEFLTRVAVAKAEGTAPPPVSEAPAPVGVMKVLEINDTSSGLSPDTEVEDNAQIAELVLNKLRCVVAQ